MARGTQRGTDTTIVGSVSMSTSNDNNEAEADSSGKIRNPARIEPICAAIEAYWKKHPDMRFGEIVHMLYHPHPNTGTEDTHLIPILDVEFDGEYWVDDDSGDDNEEYEVEPFPTGLASAPKHPDGTKYPHDCCLKPDVWNYSDKSTRCTACGYIWEEGNDE